MLLNDFYMNKKFLWILWALFLFLFLWNFVYQKFSSSNTSQSAVENGKKDFVIQVKKVWNFSTGWYLLKNGKVTSTEEIKLASQATGRVSKINVKEGDKVQAGQVLVSLSDNIASYTTNLERARNNLQRTQLNYDSTKLQLDEQITQQQIALEKLNNNLQTLKKNSEIQISQIKDDVNNSNYNNLDSASSLQLQKLDASIAKAELDYQNGLNANQQTIDSFKTTLKNSYNGLDNFTQDIVDFWDKMFAITGKYDDDLSKKYESYLGGKNKTQRDATKQALITLINFRKNTLTTLDVNNVSEDALNADLSIITQGYDLSKKYLDSFKDTLALSISSIWILSEGDIAWYNASLTAYETLLQTQNTAFITFNNSATTFLKTYKNGEASGQKQIDLLKQDRDILLKSLTTTSSKTDNALTTTETSTSDSIRTLELQIKSSQSSLDNSKASRDVTLLTLQNAIRDSQISYDAATKEFAKLTITSPIDGVIWDVLIDKWQDVSAWTPLLTVLWDKKSEIEVALKTEELNYISVGDKVTFTLNGKDVVGTIYSITNVTDNDFNYKANVIFDTQFDTIGWIVTVKVPVKSQYPLVPLSSVKIIGTNQWILSFLNDGKVLQKEVILGKIYDSNVEIVSYADKKPILPNEQIILTDVSNYDENNFNLKVEQ